MSEIGRTTVVGFPKSILCVFLKTKSKRVPSIGSMELCIGRALLPIEIWAYSKVSK